MSQNEFSDLEPWRAKVDYHCIALASGTEIAERLSDVFRGDSLDSLQFNDETALYEQVSEVVSKDSAIFIAYL